MEADNSKDAIETAGTPVTAGMPTTEKTMFATAKATIAIKIIQAKVQRQKYRDASISWNAKVLNIRDASARS